MKSYKNKKLGGYISINNEIINYDNEGNEKKNINEDENDLFSFRYDLIYKSFDIESNLKKRFLKRLNEIKDYINKNNKRPSSSINDDEIKSLGCFLDYLIYSYTNQINIMKNKDIYNEFSLFLNEFKDKLLIYNEKWMKMLNLVKDYIDLYGKKPSSCNDKETKALSKWLEYNINTYKKKSMKDSKIYQEFDSFFKDYHNPFLLTNHEKFLINLKNLKEYIHLNNKIPDENDIDNKDVKDSKNCKKLFNFFSHCLFKYNNKINCMKIKEYYDEFTLFLKEYNHFFLTDKEKFLIVKENFLTNLNNLKEFIRLNKKLPKYNDKNVFNRTCKNYPFSFAYSFCITFKN
jgi:hypothetical protein